MNRYFAFLAYKGTHYCGWQRQPNGISIQQCIEEALFTISRNPISIIGAGRTDAGVHAFKMAAHFDWNEALLSPDLLTEKLNRILPKDIAVHQIVPVKKDAHARFDALSRTYQYYITDRKNPFDFEWVYRIPLHKINFHRMNEACEILYEYNDFTSFSKLHTDVKTNNCRIIHAEWKQENYGWIFTIQADRFLRNMVRAIVGTLLEIGKGKRSVANFRKVIEMKDRCLAGSSAPGHGLSLVQIDYPENIFLGGI